MDYFKIYPKAIYLYPEPPGNIVGMLRYELEQYGCFYKSRSCAVSLVQDEAHPGTWTLVAEEFEAGNSSFTGFMDALNYYINSVLGVDAFEQLAAGVKTSVNLHFNEVLFDVESRRIVKSDP